MSTRWVVAYQRGDGWKGVYVHSSGYPVWGGARVLEYVWANGPTAVRDLIELTPQGFSSFPDGPYEPDGEMVYTDADERDDPEAALVIEWVYVVADNGTVTIFGGWPLGARRYCWRVAGQVVPSDPINDLDLIERRYRRLKEEQWSHLEAS